MNQVKCRICRRDIIWIRDIEGKPVAVNAALRPYRRLQPQEQTDRLYTGAGVLLRGRLLPDEEWREADGMAHTVHRCGERRGK